MHGLAAIFSGVPGAGDLTGGNKHVGGQDGGADAGDGGGITSATTTSVALSPCTLWV